MYELELHLLIESDPTKVALLINRITENLLEMPQVDRVAAWPDPEHPVFDNHTTTD